MSTIKDDGLLEAAQGSRGNLDAWLELHDEAEVRAAILALANPETLRDKFAAKAMQGILCGPCSRDGVSLVEWMDVPVHAYAIADAMLAAREVQP